MLDQLLDQLYASDDEACEAGALALGATGDVALPRLRALLSDDNINARFWTVRALWAMGTPAAIHALIGVLDDPDQMVRSGAALALGELKARIAIDRLAQLLTEEQDGAGDHAADALSKIGQPAAGVLIKALGAPHARVRIRAARAIVSIQSPDAIPALFQALDDSSCVVRHYAEKALVRMGVGQMVYFTS